MARGQPQCPVPLAYFGGFDFFEKILDYEIMSLTFKYTTLTVQEADFRVGIL